MVSFGMYMKKYLGKNILIDCINMKQIQGELESIYGSCVVIKMGKVARITIQLNAIVFIQEVDKWEGFMTVSNI